MEIDGQKPSIVGLECEALLAQTYAHQGTVVDRANSVYMKFGGHWHRLYFDFDTIFWRKSEREPEEFEAPELDATYSLEDVAARFSLHGRRLEGISEVEIDGGVAVDFSFEGQAVRFWCVNDVTGYSG